jgi:hypothetical protein
VAWQYILIKDNYYGKLYRYQVISQTIYVVHLCM